MAGDGAEELVALERHELCGAVAMMVAVRGISRRSPISPKAWPDPSRSITSRDDDVDVADVGHEEASPRSPRRNTTPRRDRDGAQREGQGVERRERQRTEHRQPAQEGAGYSVTWARPSSARSTGAAATAVIGSDSARAASAPSSPKSEINTGVASAPEAHRQHDDRLQTPKMRPTRSCALMFRPVSTADVSTLVQRPARLSA